LLWTIDMRVEIIYASADEQDVLEVDLDEGATALDAVHASGIARRRVEIDLARLQLGRFGRRIAPQALVQEGDRIEILRPLPVDPKEARRLRARRKAATPRR
jgi:putative ubiquitin-RnfH superfamily antitoxin RatB of RatAB toxin-antitoxin module